MSFESFVSTFIPQQVPDFVKRDHPLFTLFLKAYYELCEEAGQPVHAVKNLRNIQDIDLTDLDLYFSKFRKEFMVNIPEGVLIDKRLLTKRIKDFYRNKGAEGSYQLLLRMLYNQEASFYYPSVDILRTSDGKWIQDHIIRAYPLSGDISGLESRKITGLVSGATATVEKVIFRQIGIYRIYELLLTRKSILGTFSVNEEIRYGDTAAKILPVITGVTITDEGDDYAVNDPITITDFSGYGAKARVKTIVPNGDVRNIGGVDYPVGSVSTVEVTDPGVFYQEGTTATFYNTGTLATGVPVIGPVYVYPGYYLNEDGQLSTTKYLQDGYFYQQFSYVVETDEAIRLYREQVKTTVHPAGLALFGSVKINPFIDVSCEVLDPGNGGGEITLEIEPNSVDVGIDSGEAAPGLGRNIFTVQVMSQLGDGAYRLGPTLWSIERDKFLWMPNVSYQPYEVEELLTAPSTFSNAAWNKEDVTVSSFLVTASGSGSLRHNLRQTDGRVRANEQYHYSAQIRRHRVDSVDGHRYVWLGEGGDTHWHGGCLDLETGQFTGNQYIDGYYVRPLDAGYWEVHIFWTRESGGGNQEIYVALNYTNNAAAPEFWAANGDEKIYVRNVSFSVTDSFVDDNYWMAYANYQVKDIGDLWIPDLVEKPWMKYYIFPEPQVRILPILNFTTTFLALTKTADIDPGRVAFVTYNNTTGQVSALADTTGNLSNFTASGAAQPFYTRADNLENLLYASEDFSNSSVWTVSHASIVANDTTGPLGATTDADLFKEDANASSIRSLTYTGSLRFIDGRRYVVSGFLKHAGRQYVRIEVDPSITPNCWIIVDTANKSVSKSEKVVSAYVKQAENYNVGWMKFELVFDAEDSDLGELAIYQSDSPTSLAYNGDNTSGNHLAQFQVRDSEADSAYVKSDTRVQYRGIKGNAAVQCVGAEGMSSTSTLDNAINNNAETVFLVVVPEYSGIVNGVILGDASSMWTLYADAGNFKLVVHDSADRTIQLPFREGKVNIVGITHTSGKVILQVNSDAVVQHTLGNISSLTGALRLGNRGGANFFIGKIARSITFDSVLTPDDYNAVYMMLVAKYSDDIEL